MDCTIFQVRVVTRYKSEINYKDGEFSASYIPSFRSKLDDSTSEEFLSLAVF